jgi:hypothetical protein
MTEPTNKPVKDRKRYITLQELYLFYRYKWYDINSSTVPTPYFPKSEISEHPYKLSKQEWLKVASTYIELLFQSLLSGIDYNIPLGLGNLAFNKVKIARDRNANKYNEFIVRWCDGYFPRLIWNKSMGAGKVKFKNKTMFSIIVLKNVYMNRVLKAIQDDRSLIYNYPTRYTTTK